MVAVALKAWRGVTERCDGVEPFCRAVSGESFLFSFIVEISQLWVYKVNSREIVKQDRSDLGSHGTVFTGRLFHRSDYHRHENGEHIYVTNHSLIT
jgi:hypothetical protein